MYCIAAFHALDNNRNSELALSNLMFIARFCSRSFAAREKASAKFILFYPIQVTHAIIV